MTVYLGAAGIIVLEPATNEKRTGDIVRVVFYGDARFCSWVSPVMSALASVPTPGGLNLVAENRSFQRDTTRSALERMANRAEGGGLAVLFAQFGLSDCEASLAAGEVPLVSAPAFEANLYEITDRGVASGASVIALITNHPTMKAARKDAKGRDSNYNAAVRDYNAIIRKVARERSQSVILFDVEKEADETSGIDGGERLVGADGALLTKAGESFYADFVTPRAIAIAAATIAERTKLRRAV